MNFFQATINLLIGYEPPPSATPNLNDQPDGDTSHADAGKFTVNPRNEKLEWIVPEKQKTQWEGVYTEKLTNQDEETEQSLPCCLKERCDFLWLCPTGGSDDTDEGEADVEGGGQGGSPGAPTSRNQPGKPSHKSVRLSRKRHRALANKPQDFQVLSEFWFLCSWIITSAQFRREFFLFFTWVTPYCIHKYALKAGLASRDFIAHVREQQTWVHWS